MEEFIFLRTSDQSAAPSACWEYGVKSPQNRRPTKFRPKRPPEQQRSAGGHRHLRAAMGIERNAEDRRKYDSYCAPRGVTHPANRPVPTPCSDRGENCGGSGWWCCEQTFFCVWHSTLFYSASRCLHPVRRPTPLARRSSRLHPHQSFHHPSIHPSIHPPIHPSSIHSRAPSSEHVAPDICLRVPSTRGTRRCVHRTPRECSMRVLGTSPGWGRRA